MRICDCTPAVGAVNDVVYGSGVLTGTKFELPYPLGPVTFSSVLSAPVMPK